MPANEFDRSRDATFDAAMFGVLADAWPGFVSCIDRQRGIVFLSRTLSRDLSEVLGKPMSCNG